MATLREADEQRDSSSDGDATENEGTGGIFLRTRVWALWSGEVSRRLIRVGTAEIRSDLPCWPYEGRGQRMNPTDRDTSA